MLTSPESVKLPEDMEKALENARITLAKIKAEEATLQKTNLNLSKEIQAICTDINNKNKDLEEKNLLIKDLGVDIETLTVLRDKIKKECEDSEKNIRQQEISILEMTEKAKKMEHEANEKSEFITFMEEEHRKKVTQLTKEKEEFEHKVSILTEALQKL